MYLYSVGQPLISQRVKMVVELHLTLLLLPEVCEPVSVFGAGGVAWKLTLFCTFAG